MFWSKKEEKAALDAVVHSAGKPATELIVEEAVSEDHVFPAAATHFGGTPYFEAGDAWPILADDGRPYDFVCQVNIQDCPERPDVPFDLFTVFLCWAATEDMDRFCVVKTYQGASASKAVTIPRPDPREATDYKVRPCTVGMGTFTTYPWSMERFPDIMTAATKFRNPSDAYEASLKRLGFRSVFRSRVGGYATWVHDNTLESDDMVLLAQIDYEPKANNCIVDAAPIYIGVSTAGPLRIETDFQTF